MQPGTRTKILAMVAALIVYGSLYPFHFALPASHEEAWRKLLLDWTLFTSKGDVAGNVALFIPFGLAGALVAPGDERSAPGTATILLLSFVLAIGAQVAQIYFPGRTPAIADVVWNMLGTVTGIGAARILHSRLAARPQAWQDAYAIPLAILALWLAAELLPFVPSLDLQAIKNSVKAILRLHLAPSDILWHAAGALVAGYALQSIVGPARAAPLLGTLVAAVVVGKILVVTRVLNASTLAGLALGYAVWYFVFAARQWVRHESWIPLAVLAAYTLKALEPYALRLDPAQFNWLPFGSMLQGSMMINTMVLVESIFFFAAILGPVRMQGSSVGPVTVMLALWVGGLEAAQMYLVGRTPDITEPLLVLLVGVLLRRAPYNTPQRRLVTPRPSA